MSANNDTLKQFLVENIGFFMYDGGSFGGFRYPKFELYARDYIEFATRELDKQDVGSLINCVSHLKRALDCQLHVFFYSFGLSKLSEKRYPSIGRKLDFLDKLGVIPPRTLTRLNHIRNRIEHSFEAPKIQDLDAYFDLTMAVVSILEKTLLLHDQIDFNIWRREQPYTLGSDDNYRENFSIKYNSEKLSIDVKWTTEQESKEMCANTDNLDEFTYFFKVWILLAQIDAFASEKYIISQL